jgi:hypothetical protein
LPDLPQVACFDTPFHHDPPRLAQLLAITRRYEAGEAVWVSRIVAKTVCRVLGFARKKLE